MAKNFHRKIRNLPTLPSVMSKIISTLDNPHSSAGDLERIIRHDQSLTAKLLAVANSAYYGFRHEISTVRRAVVGVGYGEVRNLVMGMSLLGFLHPSTFNDKEMAENLWLHSLAVSECCRILGEVTGLFDQESAFTAGLLHDIGKVVLAAFFAEEVAALKYTIECEGLTFREGERVMEMEHDRVGGSLADHWELPPMLVEVITRHHSPSPTLNHFAMVSAVHVADFICRGLGFVDNYRTDDAPLNLKSLDGINMKKENLKDIARKMHGRRKAVEALWEGMIANADASGSLPAS